MAFKALSVTIAKGHAIGELSNPSVAAPVWKRIVDSADRFYEPGKFTTFAAYEWTATPGARNLHRNVFFRDSKKVPKVHFFGVHGTVDDTPEKRVNGATLLGLNSLWVSPAGLSAVWADENTREAIFAGLRRKETYTTSGVRIQLRFFGGWGLDPALPEQSDWTKAAYAAGVPMGADLPAPAAAAPSFAVSALKDPDSANLDRIQIVKGWSQSGQSFEKIYDVASSGARKPDPTTGRLPPVGNTVNLAKGTYTDSIGESQLATVWTDPDFDPSLDAFYYVRVLEIPTPRWSAIQAVKLGRVPPAGVAATIQERAWSSPIWYAPSAEARRAAKPGPTVAELLRQGAVALDDAQLRKLVVGRTLGVRNSVTGQHFEILYGSGGKRLVTAVDGKAPGPSAMAEAVLGGEAQYEIRDGRLTTQLVGTPFEVTVYRLGERIVAARSNEQGYANYEVTPKAE